jgi:hypothetical protein
MFLTVLGVLLVSAVENVWVKVLGVLVIAAAAIYLFLRSLDCIVDSSKNRVALVTGRLVLLRVGAVAFPFSGWREDGSEHAKVGTVEFWLPPGASALSGAGEISVYFAPRSRVVVNAEFAASADPDASAHG